jgi:hypothetical protein
MQRCRLMLADASRDDWFATSASVSHGVTVGQLDNAPLPGSRSLNGARTSALRSRPHQRSGSSIAPCRIYYSDAGVMVISKSTSTGLPENGSRPPR